MKRFSAIDGVLVSGRRAMIPSTIISGVVQSLIFLATLKYLGVALDSLALIPGIFINGIVAVFMVVPLTGLFLYGLALSFGTAALGRWRPAPLLDESLARNAPLSFPRWLPR